jgi:hypothetical protein
MSRMNYPPFPPATVLKLESPKTVYWVFRLVSLALIAPDTITVLRKQGKG